MGFQTSTGRGLRQVLFVKSADLIDSSLFLEGFLSNRFHANKLGLDPVQVLDTVDTFNRAVRDGTFHPGELDDCHTDGLTPSKNHWAVHIDTAPF